MELNDRVSQLEDEIKLLKNEVQAVLLDLRESYLNLENPFSQSGPPLVAQPVIINQPPPAPVQEAPVAAPPPIPDPKIVEESPIVTDQPPAMEEPVHRQEEPTYESEVASDVAAPKEVVRAWRPMVGPEPPDTGNGITGTGYTQDGEADHSSPNARMDVATVASLADWTVSAVKHLGVERTRSILDISEMMDHLTPEVKGILEKIVSPVTGEYAGKPTTRDYLASLLELDVILGKESKSELALLSILCQGNDSG